MKKLVYISSIAAPHQIKLCYALNEYFNTEFWFYDGLGKRAQWWKTPLGEKCKLLTKVLFKRQGKFLTLQHLNWLNEFNPDVLIIGGFSIPGNYIAYLWAKFNKKKVIVFTERSRNKKGELRNKNWVWKLLWWLYQDIDMIMVSEEDIVPQFRDEFGFGNKVVASRYASDINSYLNHTFRKEKVGYTFMFPNRLVDIYNPIEAIQIFYEIQKKYPQSNLVMNALGSLRKDCEELIGELNILNNVEFLDNIVSWDNLHEEYQKCDIMLFPAKFSNGNFTIIEAMASGMGIIISDKILGVGTYIENEFNGFRIPLNRELFIEKIEKYIDNPSLLKKHASLNRKLVKPLGPNGTAKLYHNLLSELFD